ncbi:hypothetical protein GC175_18470 [bacterium]|nr:hypothetical protein [bacterium]
MSLLIVLLAAIVLIVAWIQQRRQARRQRQLLLRQLRAWLRADESLAPDLQRWIVTLSADEADVLLDLLNGYFASLNWELTWLFSPHLQKLPTLKQAAEEGVRAYMRSILASLQLVEDVSAYNTYLDLLKKPKERRQFSLIQKIYSELAAHKIVKPVAKKRGLFAQQTVRKAQIAAVLEAFESSPDIAMRLLKTLLTAEATAEIQKMADPAAAAAGQKTVSATV